MFKELKKVFGETIIYGFTGVVSTLASVFLVPIYTRILTPSDYGVSALLSTSFSIIAVIANMGMSSAIFWAYFKAGEKERKSVIGTAFIFQTVFPFLIAITALMLSGFISRSLFGNESYTNLVAIASATLFFNVSVAVSLAMLRARGEPTRYVSVNLIGLFVTIATSLVLVVGFRTGLVGMFAGNLIGALAMYLSGLAIVLPRLTLIFSKFWIREMLSFGAPMMPAGLAMWALNSSDRYFLNAFASTADVGIYNVGYKIGTLVVLVTGALQLAYPRFMFSIYHKYPNPKEYFKKINTYFYLLIFTCALALSIFSKEAITILTGDAFHSAYSIVPLIAFSYVFYGLFNNFGTGVLVTSKTYLSTFAVLIAGGTNLALNYVLVSKFGMIGAALATFLSFFVLAAAELFFSQRVYPIRFEFKRLITISIVGWSLTYLATLIDFGLPISLLLKVIMLFAFPAILYLLGFFENREINNLLKIWSVIRSGRGSPRKMFDSIKQELIT